MKKIIMLQGPGTYNDNLYSFYKDEAIFSTWDGERSSFKRTCYSSKPSNPGVGNSNLQFYGCKKGCEYAASLGYEYVLKIRSDLLLDKFNDILNGLPEDKITVLGYHNWSGGYLIDYIIGGPIDVLHSIWNYDTSSETVFSERVLTDRVKQKVNSVNYLFPILFKDSIKCYSLKWETNITENWRVDKTLGLPETI